MVKFLELPCDVIDRIVRLRASDSTTYFPFSRSPTAELAAHNLAPLNATCKTLSKFARPLVWKTFHITIRVDSSNDRTIKRIRFVSRRVRISSLIKEISVWIEGSERPSCYAEWKSSDWDVLQTNLSPLLNGGCRSLAVFDWEFHPNLAVLHPGRLRALEDAISRSKLKRLRFFDVHYPAIRTAWMPTASLTAVELVTIDFMDTFWALLRIKNLSAIKLVEIGNVRQAGRKIVRIEPDFWRCIRRLSLSFCWQ